LELPPQGALSALKTKEATGKRKHTGLPAPGSLAQKNLRKSA
jgi:hypothetical protein